MLTGPEMRTRIIPMALVAIVALVPSAFSEDSPKDKAGYRYSIDFTTANTPSWQKHLGNLAGRANARGLEIGCFEGRSTLWFLEKILTHPDARMACIDVFTDEIEANFDHNVKLAGQQERVIKYKGYSQDVLRALEYDSYDFIYIDGCHLASCALTDAVLSWDLLKRGGFLIFDDYSYGASGPSSERPTEAIDAFLAAFIDQIVVLHAKRQVVIERRGGRTAEELVGKPVVHDPKWMARWRRISEQKKSSKQNESKP
jgi:predicted O-methyltransferase YrrM